VAQRTGSNSSPRSNSPRDFADNHDRANYPVGCRGSDAHSGNTSARSTSGPTLSASSTTSNTGNATSVTSTMVVPRQSDTATGQAEKERCIASYSRPAYASSSLSEPSSQMELALRASALETGKAMVSNEPLAELQKIFSGPDAVRLELPDLRGQFGLESVLGVDSMTVYDRFRDEGWLEKLDVRHFDLAIEPCSRQAGLSFEEHQVFLRNVIGTCNKLAKNGNAGVTLAIEVPLPRFPSTSPMNSYVISMIQLGLKHLFQALQADKVTVRLGLSGIRSEWFLRDILSDYFASLATNGKLEALDLSHANLSDDDACALARALKENRSIKLLNMTGCRTAEDGAEALASVLAARKGFQVIT
jgi:hypothetical protein